jgi:tetratricopeptide (TPR) repeat protein
MLMLDAEWILHNGSDLLQYCQEHKNNSETLYYLQTRDIDITFYHARLMRCRSNIKFVGKVHEVPNVMPQATIPGHIYFELCTTDYGQEKSQNRWLRDRDLLLQELQENPTNQRAMYYLAQTFFCLGDLQNSIKWYELRATMPGWDEENFFTLFILAQVYEAAGNTEKMIYNYLKAFMMRPHRAEPLIKLAEYYYKIESFHLCYLFARHACTIPYPYNDYSLIEKWLYNFARYDLLSATAYIANDFSLGELATIKALEACPEKQYLLDNLHYYQNMLLCKKGTS